MPSEFAEEKKGADPCDSNADLCQWWKQFDDPVLDSLITEAAQANFDIRIALEKIFQARSQYRVQSAHLWPEFDFNAVATRSRISRNLFNTQNAASAAAVNNIFPTYESFFQVGFDAIWEFDIFGKFRRAKQAAYYDWEASKEDAQVVLITTLSEVARNYVSIRALQKKIDLAYQKVQVDEIELALTQDLYQSGLNNEIQLDALISTLEKDKASIPVLETSFKQTLFALAVLLGQQPENLIAQFNEIKPIPSAINRVPIGLPSDLLRRRPDIRRAERQLAAATEQIGVAVADLFPHISLTGNSIFGSPFQGSSIGFQSIKLGKLFNGSSNFWSLGPGLHWNVFDFGKTRANIDVYNSLQRQALLSYEQTVITSLQDVEAALVAYFEEQKRRDFLGDQVEANQRALLLTNDLYQTGLANEQQVLDARKTLIESETTLIESEQSFTSDLISLYKALGGNWECSYTP